MQVARFLSRRIRHSPAGSFTATVMRIAVASIAVGLAVLIVSYAILGGFRETIQDKIFSLAGQLLVTKFTLNKEYEEVPVSLRAPFYRDIQQLPGVRHIQAYSLKPALLKTKEEVHGVVMKGVGEDFNRAAFDDNVVAGRFLSFSDTTTEEVLLSERIAQQMRLGVGDQVLLYFLQEPPRYRRLTVVGVYETGLEEFDETFLIGDLRLLRELNGWADTLAGGYELYVDDFSTLDATAETVYDALPYDLTVARITDRYPQLFDWLFLLGRNVQIFLVLILVVACFNMVSTLLIMIMERTSMIGVLKALGASGWQLRRLFVLNGVRLIGRGLLYGNVLGLGLCAVQYFFRLIPLDPENYYMTFVPIHWDWFNVVWLNLLILGLTTSALLLPTLVISRIQPIRAIRFD